MARKLKENMYERDEAPVASPEKGTNRSSSIAPSMPNVDTGFKSSVSKNAIYTDPIASAVKERGVKTQANQKEPTSTAGLSRWEMNSTKYRMPNIDTGTSLTGLSAADAWHRINSRAFMYANSTTDTEREVNKYVFTNLWQAFQTGQDSPGSAFYNPYRQPTNKAYAAFSEMGIDATQLTTQQLLEMVDKARYTETGHTPAAPTKTSTPEQNQAYWAYQILTNQDRTQKAVDELADVQRRVDYYVQQGLSDDEIAKRIQAEYDRGTYSTLRNMDDSRTTGTATVLNQAVDWLGMDSVQGMIWSARNDGQTFGSSVMNAGAARYGLGNRYKADAEAEAMRDASNADTYHPYVRGTTLEDEAYKYGVSSFDQTWLDENRSMLNGTDAERKAYNNIKKAVDNADAATAELDKLNAWAQTQIEKGKSWEQIQEAMQDDKFWNDYKTLKKMEDERTSGGALAMGYAVDFSLPRWEASIQQQMEPEQPDNELLMAEIDADPRVADAVERDIKGWLSGNEPRTTYGEQFMSQYAVLFPSIQVDKQTGGVKDVRGISGVFGRDDALGDTMRGLLQSVESAAANGYLSADDQASFYMMAAKAMDQAAAAGMDLDTWLNDGNAPELTGVNQLIDERRVQIDQDRKAEIDSYNKAMGNVLADAYDAVINGTATEDQQAYYNSMAASVMNSMYAVQDAYSFQEDYSGVKAIYDPAVRDTIRQGIVDDLIATYGDNFDDELYRTGIDEMSEAIAAMAAAAPELEKWNMVASALNIPVEDVYQMFGVNVDMDAIIAREKQAFYDEFAPRGLFDQIPGVEVSRDEAMEALSAGAQTKAKEIQEARGGYEEPEEEDQRAKWSTDKVWDIDLALDEDTLASVQSELEPRFKAKYGGVYFEDEAAKAVAALMYENESDDITEAMDTLTDRIDELVGDGMEVNEAIRTAAQETAEAANAAFTQRVETSENQPTAMEQKYGDKTRPVVWGIASGARGWAASGLEDYVWWLAGSDDQQIAAARAKYNNDPVAYKEAIRDYLNRGGYVDPNTIAFAQYVLSDEFEGDIFSTGLLDAFTRPEQQAYKLTARNQEVAEHMEKYGTTVENLLYNGTENITENSIRMGVTFALNAATGGLVEKGSIAAGLMELLSTTTAYGMSEGRELGQWLESEYGVSHVAAQNYGFVAALGTGLLEKLQMEKYVPGALQGETLGAKYLTKLAQIGWDQAGAHAKNAALALLMSLPESAISEALQEGTETVASQAYKTCLEYLYAGDAERTAALWDAAANGSMFVTAAGDNINFGEIGQSMLMAAMTAPFLSIEGAFLAGGIEYTSFKVETRQAIQEAREIMKDPEKATPEQYKQAALDMAMAMQDPAFQEAMERAGENIVTAESVVAQVTGGAMDDLLTGKEATARNDAKANLDRATEQRDRDAAQVKQLTEALSGLTQQITQAEVVTEDMANAVAETQTQLEEAAKQAEASTQAFDEAEIAYNAADTQYGALMKERLQQLREQAQAEARGEKNRAPRTTATNFAAQAALADSRAAISGTTLDKAKARQARAAAELATFTDELNNGRIKPSTLRTQAPRFATLRSNLEAANAEVEAETQADIKKRFPAQARLQSSIQTMQEAAYGSEEFNRASNDAAMAGAESEVIQAERAVEEARNQMDAANPETVQAYEAAQQNLQAKQEAAQQVRTRLATDTKRRAANALRERGFSEIAAGLESRNTSEITDTLIRMREEGKLNIREAAEAAGIDWQSNEYRPLSDETLNKLDAVRRNKPGLTDATNNKRAATPEIKAQKRVLNALGKKYGFEVVMVDDLEGRYNGMYRGGRTVYVAANAVEGALVQTGMHEAVHMVKAQNAESYGILVDAVKEALGPDFDWDARIMALQQGTDLTEDAAIEEIVAEATAAVFTDKTALQSIMKKDGGTTLRRIADALRGFWEDLKALVTRYAGKQNAPEIQSMLDAGQEQMNAVAAAMDAALGIPAYEGDFETLVAGETGWKEAQQAVLEERKKWYQNRKIFEAAMAAEQENNDVVAIDTNTEPATLEDGTKVVTDAQALGMALDADGNYLFDFDENPKYSRRSMVGYQTDGTIEMDPETGYYMNGDLYKIRQELGKRVGTNQQIMTQEEIDDLTRSVQAVVDYIDEHQGFRIVLDHNWDLNNEDRAFSPVKANADKHYKAAVDFSTLCRKRVTLQMIAEELAARTGRAVTPEEGAVLRDYLKDIQKELQTVEVACALCYVEAARNNSVKYQNEFLENREAALRTYFSLKDSKWTKMVLQAEQNRYRAENNVEKRGANPNKGDLTAAQRTEYEALTRRLRQERPLTEREQAIVDAANQMDPSMFLTADGLKRLKLENPDVYGAYIAYVVSRAKAKSMEMEVPYLLGDLTAKIHGKKLVGPALIKAMNLESGLRHQSWSDLETKHILDTISAIVDMSLNGAKAHTYTKVPDMIRLIGKTNMMANMSLIPLGETGMQNGELAFDPVEGMPWETMLELRDQYRMTAGNIAIGINDEQIQAMMESDLIDYIIPYHVSGMSAEMRKTLGIEAWRDATQIQNEKTRDSSKPAGKAPALREWFDIDEGLSDEWKDRPYEYMEYCAQRYLKLCEERNLVPKFEKYSGQRGYWKMLVDRKMIAQAVGDEPAVLIRQEVVKPVFDQQTLLDIMEREVNSGRMQEQQEAIRRTVNAVLSGELSLSEEMDQLIKKFANDQYEITSEIEQSDREDAMEAMTNPAAAADQAERASYIESAIDRRLAEAIRNGESYELGRYMEQSVMDEQARAVADQKVRSGEWATQEEAAPEEAAPEEAAPEEAAPEADNTERLSVSGTENPVRSTPKAPSPVQKAMGTKLSTQSNATVDAAKRTAFSRQRGQQAIQRPVTIAKTLARQLDVPLHRNLRQRGGNGMAIRGAYCPALQTIEVRGVDTGELRTTMHEIGHHLQDRLGMQSTQQMMTAFNETNEEAFAEFVATYMFDRDMAVQQAGAQFVDDFETRMRDNGCYNDVAAASAQIREWAAADAWETIEADLTTHAEAERNAQRNRSHQFFRRMMTWFNAAYAFRNADYRAADRQGQITRNGERVLSAGEQYMMSQHIPKMATRILRDHLVDINGRVIDNRSIADIMARNGIDNDNQRAFAAYLYAQHALDRAAVGKEVWTDELKSPEAARTVVDSAPANFVAAANEYYDFMHKFRQAWMVDTGLITQQQMDEWEQAYPHYIPMYADLSDFAEDFGLGTQFGGTGFGDEWHFHEAHASNAPRIIFWESMPDLVSSVVRRAARNSVAQALYYEVHENEEALRDVAHISRVHEITQGNNGQSVESPASAPNAVEVLLPGGRRATIEVTDGLLLDVLNSHGSHGALTPWLRAAKKMTRLMSSLTTSRNPIFAATNFLRDSMGAVTYGATADGAVTGGAATIVDQMLNAMRAGFHYATNTGDSGSYADLGGGGEIYIGSTSEQEARKTKRSMIQGYNEGALDRVGNVARSALDVVTAQRPAEISEQATRLAQYERSLAHYTRLYGDTEYSRARAFLDSQQATVDFAQGGYTEGYQKLRAIIPFMNPTFQGAYQNLEMIHDAFALKGVTAEQRRVAQTRLAHTVLHYGLMAAAQMAVLRLFMDDDEREKYAMTAEDIRNSTILLPSRWLGGTEREFIRLPIGQGGVNALIYGALLKAAGQAQDEMDLSFQNVIMGALGELSPLDFTQGFKTDDQGRLRFNLRNELAGLANSTIMGPLASISANRNYYGSEIVPSYMEEWPTAMQRYNSTPDAFVTMSKALSRVGLDVSPLHLQYLTEQYGGVFGQYVLPLMSKDPATGEWSPSYAIDKTWRVARNRFTIEPAYSNDIVQRYSDNYADLKAITKAYDSGEDEELPLVIPSADRDEVKALVDELMTQYSACNKEVNALNKEMKEIRNSTEYDYGTKQAMLRDLTMEQVKYEAAWNELYDAFMMQYGYGSLAWNLARGR